MLTSDSIATIMPAFIKAQSNFAKAVKSATNPHFKSKYVALDGVIDAVAPALRDNDIAIMQMTDIQDARTVLETRLIHASGEWIGSRYPVHPVKADPQGEGSALTYARRYALMALVGIAPEDDDGNAAVKAVQSIKPVERGQPTSGAWESMSPEAQAFLQSIAEGVAERLTGASEGDAWDYLVSQNLDADEKIALWTRLGSSQRSALKRAEAAIKARKAA